MNQSADQQVLVTGGTGFIAGWCVVELLQRGYRVRTTVRSLSKEPAVRAAIARHVDPVERLEFVVADLTADDGWQAAMSGCQFVLHVASPLGGAGADAAALIGPAREGTLRVLRFAVQAGVERVVMTSAAAAARPRLDSGRASDESTWADPDDPQFDGYRISKILAERAAWDFMKGSAGRTTLTTILPGAVFGPVLAKENLGSVRIIHRLLEGKPPALPRLGFAVVDVRDLADLHIRAMTAPEAAGERFLAAGEFMWMEEIARTLRSALGEQARKVSTRRLPDVVFRVLARFSSDLGTIAPLLGRVTAVTSEKARRTLLFSPRPAATTVIDTARSLLA